MSAPISELRRVDSSAWLQTFAQDVHTIKQKGPAITAEEIHGIATAIIDQNPMGTIQNVTDIIPSIIKMFQGAAVDAEIKKNVVLTVESIVTEALAGPEAAKKTLIQLAAPFVDLLLDVHSEKVKIGVQGNIEVHEDDVGIWAVDQSALLKPLFSDELQGRALVEVLPTLLGVVDQVKGWETPQRSAAVALLLDQIFAGKEDNLVQLVTKPMIIGLCVMLWRAADGDYPA